MSTIRNQANNNASSPGSICFGEDLPVQQLEAYFLFAAIGLIVILALFEKWRDACHTGCLGGRTGCLIPVNLLDGDRDRLAYAAAFGCTASTIVTLLTSKQISSTDYSAMTFYLTVLLSSVLIGITYYPLFVCLAPSYRFVHSTIGLGYTIVWLVFTSMRIEEYIKCFHTAEPETNIYIPIVTIIMMYIPQLVCLLYLALRFVYMLATDVTMTVRDCRQRNPDLRNVELDPDCTIKLNSDRLANSKQLQHVRELFCRTDEATPYGKYKSKMLDTLQLSYKGDRAFRYSHRVVATFTVALICLYQISVLVCGIGTWLIIEAQDYADSIRSQNSSDSIFRNLIEVSFIDTFAGVAKVSFYVSFTITTLMSGVMIFQIMISYRKNMEALYRGDFSVISSGARQHSAVSVMTDNLHYPGSQIAYLFWSYVIQLIVLFIVCLFVAYLIILPILGDVPESFLQPFLTVLSTSAIGIVTYLLQRFVSNRWLLQDHKVLNRKSDKSETVLSLNNRKIYHNMAYFVFFYYIFIGLVRCLMKIFKAIFLGVVFFGRIDRSGLMSGFEAWDTGYMAYVSFLQMELVHCHPVLVVFCDHLCHRLPGNMHVPMHGTSSSTHGTKISRATSNEALVTSSSVERYGTTDKIASISSKVSKYNRRIHNRWLKVYTLLKNPSLVVKQS